MDSVLPHVNASLNALAAILLVTGYVLIKGKQRNEEAHKKVMLSCFGVSVLFLICYVIYHAQHGSQKFPTDVHAGIRYTYLAILASHIILAALVPFLAVWTIWLGLKDRRELHVKVARWTFPIWLYVSITGVIVYVMLYHLFRSG